MCVQVQALLALAAASASTAGRRETAAALVRGKVHVEIVYAYVLP